MCERISLNLAEILSFPDEETPQELVKFYGELFLVNIICGAIKIEDYVELKKDLNNYEEDIFFKKRLFNRSTPFNILSTKDELSPLFLYFNFKNYFFSNQSIDDDILFFEKNESLLFIKKFYDQIVLKDSDDFLEENFLKKKPKIIQNLFNFEDLLLYFNFLNLLFFNKNFFFLYYFYNYVYIFENMDFSLKLRDQYSNNNNSKRAPYELRLSNFENLSLETLVSDITFLKKNEPLFIQKNIVGYYSLTYLTKLKLVAEYIKEVYVLKKKKELKSNFKKYNKDFYFKINFINKLNSYFLKKGKLLTSFKHIISSFSIFLNKAASKSDDIILNSNNFHFFFNFLALDKKNINLNSMLLWVLDFSSFIYFFRTKKIPKFLKKKIKKKIYNWIFFCKKRS